MELEFFVEEPSAEVALRKLLPTMLPDFVRFDVHSYSGKEDMLKKLPDRLKGIKWRFKTENLRIVVLIDEDREDCHKVKQRLESIAETSELVTKSAVRDGNRFHVLNRVVVEELEAWFFGDIHALRLAYPRVPASLANQTGFRDPDSIKGGTWEALERILRKYGYHRGGLNKMQAAGDIALHMDPYRNQSKSFQVFRDGITEIVQFAQPAQYPFESFDEGRP